MNFKGKVAEMAFSLIKSHFRIFSFEMFQVNLYAPHAQIQIISGSGSHSISSHNGRGIHVPISIMQKLVV
jgi:hypothetical protein